MCLKATFVGEPDAGNPHVRFDERDVETGHGEAIHRPLLNYRATSRLYADCFSLAGNNCKFGRQAFRENNQSRARYSVQQRTPLSSIVVRAKEHVHPVRKFALCIGTAPRQAATFGSFWSLQKEPAGGKEFGERLRIWSMFSFVILIYAGFLTRIDIVSPYR